GATAYTVNVVNGSAPVQNTDLSLTGVTYTSGSFAPGTILTVSGTEQNQGTIVSNPYKVLVVLSQTPYFSSSNDVVLGSIAEQSLEGSSSHPFSTTVTIPANTGPGTYYVLTKVDSGAGTSETNEQNNVFVPATADVSVTLPPPVSPPPASPPTTIG